MSFSTITARQYLLVGVLAISVTVFGCSSLSDVAFQTNGAYIVSLNEQRMGCDQLHKTAWGHIQLMKTLPAQAKAEANAPPPNVILVIARLSGTSNKGLTTIARYDNERAHVDVLLAEMARKDCPTNELDREIITAEKAMAEIRTGP